MQETKLSEKGKIYLKGFESFYKNTILREPNEHAHGGVAILASEKCSKHEIKLNTNLQAVAISIKLSKRISICSLYCPPNTSVNSLKKDLETLLDQLPKPFLVLGDFNAQNPIWFSDKVDDKGAIIEQILLERDIYFLDKDKNTHYYSYNNQLRSSHIDLSLCSTSLLMDFKWGLFDQLMGSDHFPIWLRSGQNRKPVSFPKWIIEKADWPKFTDKAVPLMSFDEFDSSEEANSYCKTFIIDAAKNSIPKSSGNERYYKPPWWNENCKIVKENRKVSFENYVEGIGSKNEWNRSKAKARQTFRWTKQNSFLKFMGSINKNTTSGEAWRKINIFTGKYNSKTVTTLKVGDRIYDDPRSIADKIGEVFEEISSEAKCSPNFLRFKRTAEKKKLNFSTNNYYGYNAPICRDELDSALENCKDTAPGPDEIHNKMLKNLPNESKDFVLNLLNSIFEGGVLPEEWKLAHIIPILKADKNPTDAKSYRPISLTSCLCKLLERILNIRLMCFLVENNCLHISQNGFQEGRSSRDNVLSLENEIHDAFVENKMLITLFF